MAEQSNDGFETARIRVDDLTLDFVQRRVFRGRNAIDLPVLSFDLLAELARAAPATRTCDELIERVWHGAMVNEETVTQRVRLLRKALGDDGRHPRYVISDRGRGYRLAVLPRRAPPPAAERRSWRGPAWAALALLATGLTVYVLLPPSPPVAAPPAVAAPAADDLVERAWTYFDRHQAEDNEIALGLFRRALEREPGHVPALAGLSMAHSQRAMKFNRPVAEALEAERIARRALAREPGSFDARMALATALDAAGRVPGAIETYEAALEIRPGHPGVLSSVAYLYQVTGRLSRGLEYALRARAGDPDLPYLDLQLGQTLRILGFEAAGEAYLVRADLLRPDNVFAAPERARFLVATGRFREAEGVVRDALARGVRRPELHEYRGILALMRDDPAAAGEAFAEAMALDPGSGLAESGAILARRQAGGDTRADYERRVAAIEAAWAAGDRWPWLQFELVQLHTAHDNLPAAEAALGRLVDAGFRDTALLLAWPGLEPLRRRPAFQDLTQRINRAVLAERERVLDADWRTADLLNVAAPEERAARTP